MVTVRDHHPASRRRTWARWARVAFGGAVIALLLAQLGPGPFLAALESVTGLALALAVGLTVVTTTCCAWRWRVVARGLGLDLPLPRAVAAYYRSQLLNSTLPGGVLGDVERAVRHGLDVGAVGRSARAVVWERVLGQAVQVVLTVLLLVVLPSPVRGVATVVLGAVVGVLVLAGGLLLLVRAVPRPRVQEGARHTSGRRVQVPRVVGAVVDDLRRVLPGPPAWYAVLLASVLVVAGHVCVFLVAMHAAGVQAPVATRLWLALVVLLAAAVPANLAGWGPREGAAAWAFGAAGLGAATGVTVSVLFGVLALVATLPGVVVLLRPVSGGRRPARDEEELADPAGGQPGAPEPVRGQEVVEDVRADLRGDRRLLRGEGTQE